MTPRNPSGSISRLCWLTGLLSLAVAAPLCQAQSDSPAADRVSPASSNSPVRADESADEPVEAPVPMSAAAGSSGSPSGAPASTRPLSPASPSQTVAAPATGTAAPARNVVASFDTQPAPRGAAGGRRDPFASAPAATDEKRLSFNFQSAPWSDVLRLFADKAGLTLDLLDVPPGTFTYYDKRQYTPTEALDVLHGYLLQKGFVMVRRDNFLVVLSVDNRAIPPNLIPHISLEELNQRGSHEIVSITLPLAGIDVEQAAKEAEALLGPQGKVVPLKTSNALAATDVAANLRRIRDLLNDVTVADPEALTFRSFDLLNVAAHDAERIVRSQLGLDSGVVNVSASSSNNSRSSDRGDRESRWGGRGGRDSGRGEQQPQPQAAPARTAAKGTQVTADFRTNRLLVMATARQMEHVEQILKAIDVSEGDVGHPLVAKSGGPFLRVYSVSTADPREVTKTLDAIMPGVVVNEDGRARKIHIRATEEDHREIEHLIRQLDGAGGAQSMTVVSLSQLDPLAAAGTLRSLFLSDGDAAPTIEADIVGRRLLIRGSVEQLAQVRMLLAELGEDGKSGYGTRRAGGPVRTIPLGGRDPQEFARLLERVWASKSDTPVRVVVPTARSPIREQRVPSEQETTIPDARRETPVPDREVRRTPRATDARLTTDFVTYQPDAVESVEDSVTPGDGNEESPEDGRFTPQTQADPAPAAEAGPYPKSPITITLSGGDLILLGQDQEALNEMEDLIASLAQAVPPKTTWTVFYLRSADATETAAMLDQLFPSSSVSFSSSPSDSGLLGSLTGGISSVGSSLMSMSGLDSLSGGSQVLRIIPDIRSNSLFVSGSPEEVQSVEDVLKVLDASELPETLRDRLPRMIPVDHADINEVAAIVKDVFKDAMTDPNAGGGGGGRGGNNPLAMLMGGGGGNDRNNRRQASAVRLTIGVDSRTSQLVVSADDTLFRQVESLVQSLDDSAMEARRTVRVVSMGNSDTVILQEALGSLLPNVKVTTTGSRNSRTSTPASTPAATSTTTNSDQRSSDDDNMRQMFQQRMMERVQERGSGGGDAGSGRGRGGFGGGTTRGGGTGGGGRTGGGRGRGR